MPHSKFLNSQDDSPIIFHTLSGELVGSAHSDGTIDMNFPSKIATEFSGTTKVLGSDFR
jgi:hypothetical protein